MVEKPLQGTRYEYRPPRGAVRTVLCEGFVRGYVTTRDVHSKRRRDVPRTFLHELT